MRQLSVIAIIFFSNPKMNCKVPDKIDNIKIVPLNQSMYLKPLRAEYNINGIDRYWDFLTVHDSVSILIFNATRKVVILVRQFRPSTYLGKIADVKVGAKVDTEQHPLSEGYTLELCAGNVDKNASLEEIAREEVLEECGYDVPVASLQHLYSLRGVGVTGQTHNLYYVEVTDKQKVSKGGGIKEEGEFIEIVELSIPELRSYISLKEIQSPPSFVIASQWFLSNVAH